MAVLSSIVSSFVGIIALTEFLMLNKMKDRNSIRKKKNRMLIATIAAIVVVICDVYLDQINGATYVLIIAAVYWIFRYFDFRKILKSGINDEITEVNGI